MLNVGTKRNSLDVLDGVVLDVEVDVVAGKSLQVPTVFQLVVSCEGSLVTKPTS